MLKLKLLFSASVLATAMAGTACGAQNNDNNGSTGATTVPPVATAAVTLEATHEVGALVPTMTPAAPVGGGAVATVEPTLLAPGQAIAPTEALATSELTHPTTEPSLAGTVAATEEMNSTVGPAPTSSASGAATSEPGMAELNGTENPASVSKIMDYKVQNSQGEDLGKIEDLMVDLNNEQVRYAVLSFGDFFNISDKLFAIPVSALRVDPTEKVVIFDVEKETLKNAPGFDQNNWPDTANPEWDVPFRDYWRDHIAGVESGNNTAQDSMTAQSDQNGANQNNTARQSDQMAQNETAPGNTSTTPGDQMAQNGTVTPQANLAQADTSADQDKMLVTTMRASELLGRNVEATQGDKVGEIQDLMADLNSGRVLYAVLSFAGFANISDKYFAIPLHVLNFNHDTNAFAFDVNENMLQNAPSFSKNDWPDKVNPNVGEEARQYWDNELSMQ